MTWDVNGFAAAYLQLSSQRCFCHVPADQLHHSVAAASLSPALSVSAEAGIISFVGGGCGGLPVHIDRSTSEAQDPLLISPLSVSLFRKSSAADGPREGELEDLHEDEPFS